MANPNGVNQLSPHGYGDKQKQTTLKRSAPISGAPMVAGALNAPQQNQRRAVRGTQTRPQGQEGPPQAPPPQPTIEAQLAAIKQQLLALPGANVGLLNRLV